MICELSGRYHVWQEYEVSVFSIRALDYEN